MKRRRRSCERRGDGRHRHLLGRGRACFPRSRQPIVATSTNWPPPGSAGTWTRFRKVQAFHFKGGQGAKTGTGGHLPGKKVSEKIAAVRGIEPGSQPSVRRVSDLNHRRISDAWPPKCARPREAYRSVSSCPHNTWKPISTSLSKSAWTTSFWMGGAVQPARLRRFSRTTSPFRRWQALARARVHLDKRDAKGVTLIATGGCAPSRTSSKRWHWVPMASRLRTRPFKPLGVSECARATRTIVRGYRDAKRASSASSRNRRVRKVAQELPGVHRRAHDAVVGARVVTIG